MNINSGLGDTILNPAKLSGNSSWGVLSAVVFHSPTLRTTLSSTFTPFLRPRQTSLTPTPLPASVEPSRLKLPHAKRRYHQPLQIGCPIASPSSNITVGGAPVIRPCHRQRAFWAFPLRLKATEPTWTKFTWEDSWDEETARLQKSPNKYYAGNFLHSHKEKGTPYIAIIDEW